MCHRITSGGLMRRLRLITAASCALTVASAAQEPPSQPGLRFEVASVKPGAGERIGETTFIVPGRFLPGGRFEARNSQLLTIIRRAYQEFSLEPGQIVGTSQLLEERFDIDGRAASDVPQDSIRFMLRQLLADRFKLKVHTETRTVDAYELVLNRVDGRLGPQIRRATTDCTQSNVAAAQGGFVPPPPSLTARPPCSVVSGIGDGVRRSYLGGRRVDNLAIVLQNVLGRKVTNRTGLTGEFDIELMWAVDESDPKLPSLFTAVREQLGLRLREAKVPMEVLVIDAVEQPTPD
jgi:uncharacterized protein (TIGR03435 family)